MGRKRKKTGANLSYKNEVVGVILFAAGAFSALSLYFTDYSGKIGSLFKTLLMGFFGIAAYIMPFFIMAGGILTIASYFERLRKSRVIITLLSAIILLSVVHLIFFNNFDIDSLFTYIASSYRLGIKGIGTGVFAAVITYAFYSLFGLLGSYIILISLFTITLLVLTKLSLKRLGQAIYQIARSRKKSKRNKKVIADNKPAKKPFVGEVIHLDDSADSFSEKELLTLESSFSNKAEEGKHEDDNIKIINFDESNSRESLSDENNTPKPQADDSDIEQLDIKVKQLALPYIKPPVSLLKESKKRKAGILKENEKLYIENAKILEDTLNSFGVSAKVLQISKGPVITRYELQPAPGVKVSRIVSLADDIALNLAAQGVRIEAPIPGKAAVGIEVPNKDVSPVLLREVIDTDSFLNHPSKIAFALGKDITGNNIIADISKMPHLLIAGATGSGKSVCINSLIISILYKANPDEVKLIMIDPKVVELNNYNGIPHLMIPVVTDPKKAAGALNWAVQEMINRYKIFAEKGVRDFERYNEMVKENDSGDALLPQIVIIIDELADLMMVAPNDVEDAICRLAQMARAAGIHLVIATQRPSVDVITGVIKANILSRIAFAVSSQVDSRTILDMSGAEKLLGRGDMLYSPVGANKPIRVQGAYISEKEVEAVVNYIKNQNNTPEYDEEVIKEISTSGEANSAEMDDDLFPEAVEIVIEAGQASISMLQRKLRIGYNRAARMIDEMEARGIVSGYNGSKSRTVLISKEEFEENYKAN